MESTEATPKPDLDEVNDDRRIIIQGIFKLEHIGYVHYMLIIMSTAV